MGIIARGVSLPVCFATLLGSLGTVYVFERGRS
jgi:hypothetical protein